KPKRLVTMLLGLHDHAPDDIAGHQIGRKLNAGITQVQYASKSAQERRLAQSRNTFQQNVPASNETDQDAVNHVSLTHYHFRDFLADPRKIASGTIQYRRPNAQGFWHF